MPSFMLRHIDAQLWQAVKAKAQQNGISVKQGVLEALAAYVSHSHSQTITLPPPQEGMKVTIINDGTVAVAVTAQVQEKP